MAIHNKNLSFHVIYEVMNKLFKGYVAGIVGEALYGLNPLFTLPLYERGMNSDSVLFWRYCISIPIVILMMLVGRKSFRITGRQALSLFILGILMSASSLTLFMSYHYMDSGLASTLLFVYPIMVAIIMAVFFHQRLRPLTLICIAAACAGIALLYNGGGGPLSLTGVAFVMGSALSFALYIIGVRHLGIGSLDTLTVIFYVLCFGILLFVGRLLFCDIPFTAPSGLLPWGCAFGLAVCPTALSFILSTIAIKYIGETPAAILGSMESVTAVIIGATVFGEVLYPSNIVGIILILGAVTGVVASPMITSKYDAARKRLRTS